MHWDWYKTASCRPANCQCAGRPAVRNNPRDMVNPALNPRAKSAIIGIAHQKSGVCLLVFCVPASRQARMAMA
jgi:hypothetical protein